MSSNKFEIASYKFNLAKKERHKQLTKEQPYLFRFMDVLVALIILMNFGAVFLTNMMVTKAAEQPEFTEVNPAMAKANNLELNVNYADILKMFLIQVIFWFVMIFFYVYYRRTVYTNLQIIVLLTFVLFYFSILGFDFFNNFGYLIGVL